MKYLLMIAAVALAGCQPTPVLQPVPEGDTRQVSAPTAATMMNLLNAARAEQGRGAVREDARLSRAARDHAQDMVDNDYFSHDSRNGMSFSARARAAGYTCASAENIAFGQRTATEVVNTWMGSAGHRVNILQNDATEFGIGRVGTMWVLMMGRGC